MQFKLSDFAGGLLDPDLSLNLNFTITASVRGTFTLEDLQYALQRLAQRHPMLAGRIAPRTDQTPVCLTTEGVPPIPLRVVERVSAQAWVREVEHEIATPTNFATGPLFRCVWVRGTDVSELVLVCDHFAADGLAGIYALRTLLELLADPDLNPEPIYSPPMSELLPPAALTRIHEILAETAHLPPYEFTFPPETAEKPTHRVIPFTFDEAETSALIARCRAENVTVQAALSTAFTLTFAELHPDAPIRRIEVPFNVRHRLREPVGEVYGDYITLICFDIDCTPGQQHAWDIARQVMPKLKNVTDAELFANPIIMMSVSNEPPRGPMIEQDYDLSLSNLGRVNIPVQYGPFTLEAIYAPTIGPSHPDHRIVGVTTFNGQMRCTFSSFDPHAPQIIQRTREILQSMLTS